MKRIEVLAALILTAAVLYALGDSQHDELAQQQRLYCQMVAEGTWPDYEHSYEEHCK